MQDDVNSLTDAEIELYARQLVLPGWDEIVQAKLLAAHIAIIGVGGLGMPVLAYLAGAGVGHITLIEADRVDITNLHRQHMPQQADIGDTKLDVARRFIETRFPNCQLTCHAEMLTDDNAAHLLTGATICVDCTDSLAARQMIARYSVEHAITHIFAGAVRHEGQISVFAPHNEAYPDSPCFGCLFPETASYAQAPNCAQAGISGPVVGMVGTMQANETLKLLTGIGTPLIGKLLLVDAAQARFDTIHTRRQPDCKICSTSPAD